MLEEKNRSQERYVIVCGRKEKHQYKIGQGLNLRRRRKEKRSVRIENLPDWKGNSPDRPVLRLFGLLFSRSQKQKK